MNYGFVIDNASCIGCHACTTACKSEHQVPLGVNRTWVKQTEVGAFPDVRRSFQVTRCNHCANPPCVRICPTGAMFQRDDGIVEFDGDACIGCKGCTQACPYDAIYIDPESRTAAKCNYCAHRVDVGVEPACVVVCPEHAIIAGDLDDPASEIRQVLAAHDVSVRKPEQGTAPKLFYIDGHDPSMHPTAASQPDSTGVWSDILEPHDALPVAEARVAQGAEQGAPAAGPLQVGGTMADRLMQVTYAPHHEVQWHWQIPAYIVTKHIAGGVFAFLSVTALTSIAPFSLGAMLGGGALAVLMTLVTLGLLIYDLDRPDRFFYLLVRPQWRSWIARAAWILSAFALVSTGWWATELLGAMGWMAQETVTTVRPLFAVLAGPLGWLTAVYTAFLFGQCEGRDLWQGSHLPAQMTVHAMMVGGAAITAVAGATALPPETTSLAMSWFGLGLLASVAMTWWADRTMPQATDVARAAALDMTEGRYRHYFWRGGLLVGHGVPLLLWATGVSWLQPLAFVAVCLGLFAYSYAFVMAPQRVPNS